MPLYDYKCSEHGLFHELVSMDNHQAPQPCPTCKTACGRVILMAPEFLSMSDERRKAHSTNEKSKHEPIISSVDSRDKKNGSGCGCEQPNAKKSQVMYLADGSKIFPSQRPWMISH